MAEDRVYRIDVRVTAPVNDTEVADRVVRAVEAIFPEAETELTDGRVVATGHAMDAFAERLRDQEILATARSVLLDRRRGDRLAFELKKQPAFEGVVNFSVGNPDELGDIHVEVTVHDPDVEAFVDVLAPQGDGDDRPNA
ncbi:MAG: RNA-binding domain-containing protein [Halobacteriaceae archaeon]